MKIYILMIVVSLVAKVSTCQVSINGIKVDSISGDRSYVLSEFSGKKILIVNTESQDSSFSQFNELVLLQQKYKDKVIVIVFPVKNSTKELTDKNLLSQKYSQKNQDKVFIGTPVSVRGADINSLYKWLTNIQSNGESGSEVKKPFYKYLINEQGKLVGVYGPAIRPMNPILQEAVTR